MAHTLPLSNTLLSDARHASLQEYHDTHPYIRLAHLYSLKQQFLLVAFIAPLYLASSSYSRAY
jgi:hypothetical protein